MYSVPCDHGRTVFCPRSQNFGSSTELLHLMHLIGCVYNTSCIFKLDMCKANERVEAAYIFIYGVYWFLKYYYVDLFSNRIVSLALLSSWSQSPGYFTTMTRLSFSMAPITYRPFVFSPIIMILFILRIHISTFRNSDFFAPSAQYDHDVVLSNDIFSLSHSTTYWNDEKSTEVRQQTGKWTEIDTKIAVSNGIQRKWFKMVFKIIFRSEAKPPQH